MESQVFLVVGLGNPGEEYAETKHNLGFKVIDELSTRWGSACATRKFKAFIGEHLLFSRKVIMAKPQTFMNRSGQSVHELISFYKLEPSQNLVVVSDDLDLPAGRIRIRKEGGSGGHNGLKSVIESLGTESFVRVRIGIGRPASPDTESYVLSRISKSEKALFEEAVLKASDAIESLLKDGINKAMDRFNRKPESTDES